MSGRPPQYVTALQSSRTVIRDDAATFLGAAEILYQAAHRFQATGIAEAARTRPSRRVSSPGTPVQGAPSPFASLPRAQSTFPSRPPSNARRKAMKRAESPIKLLSTWCMRSSGMPSTGRLSVRPMSSTPGTGTCRRKGNQPSEPLNWQGPCHGEFEWEGLLLGQSDGHTLASTSLRGRGRRPSRLHVQVAPDGEQTIRRSASRRASRAASRRSSASISWAAGSQARRVDMARRVSQNRTRGSARCHTRCCRCGDPCGRSRRP